MPCYAWFDNAKSPVEDFTNPETPSGAVGRSDAPSLAHGCYELGALCAKAETKLESAKLAPMHEFSSTATLEQVQRCPANASERVRRRD